MAKITIFLCAVLFAAAADASLMTRLANAQQRVDAFVAAEIDNVENIYKEATKRVTDLVGELDKAADNFTNKTAEDVKKIGDKLREDIKILFAGSKDVDLSECDKSEENVHNITKAVVSNITECIVKKKETALKYIENINDATTNVTTKLMAVREEARRCGENVETISSALHAIGCMKMARVRGAFAVAKSVPALSINIGKMTFLLSTLKPSLAICSTTHGLSSFYRESRTIIKNTKTCIQQKREEARLKPTM